MFQHMTVRFVGGSTAYTSALNSAFRFGGHAGFNAIALSAKSPSSSLRPPFAWWCWKSSRSHSVGKRAHRNAFPDVGGAQVHGIAFFSTGEDLNVELTGASLDDLSASRGGDRRRRLREYPGVSQIADTFRIGQTRDPTLDIRPQAEVLGLTLDRSWDVKSGRGSTARKRRGSNEDVTTSA